MQSHAATVAQYLAELPADRRAAIAAVRAVILANLDADVDECMNYGMIGYVVPHRVYPPGYHCNPKLPLPYISLASQKGHMSLYLGSVYCGCGTDEQPGDNLDAAWFRERWAQTGKRLDMGKACIRFKQLDDLALDVIAEAIKRVPTRRFIESYEANLAAPRSPGKPTTKVTTKPTTKVTTNPTTKVTAKPTTKVPAKPTTKVPADRPAPARPPARKKRA